MQLCWENMRREQSLEGGWNQGLDCGGPRFLGRFDGDMARD